jgi:hypothetical protein
VSEPDQLHEYRAAVAKIDDAVARASASAADALACKRGCASCCVDGLSVLPVEAAAIRASGLAPPARPTADRGMCAFLDHEGACSIYAARPVLCRTHGMALKMAEAVDDAEANARPASALRILGDDVTACALNFTNRSPRASEVLDATRLSMLVVTVDRRYRARAGIADAADEDARIALRTLAGELHATRADDAAK